MPSASWFVTSNVAGPAASVCVVPAHPFFLITSATLRLPLDPELPLDPDLLDDPHAASASAARARTVTERRNGYSFGTNDSGRGRDRFGLALRRLLRPQHECRHRNRVREPHEDLTDRRFGLEAEHPGDQRGAHTARVDEPAQVERL